MFAWKTAKFVKDFGKESFKDVTYDEILDKFFSWFYAGVDAEN